ncbi:ATP-binding protein [Streptomyces sodiiphilus]|uniref:ATP-binding protein n=1 Tax=Streptomyces sodiiphilus TaxID=226217 RepID=A0ABN2NTF9_9ACTN
MHFIHPGLAEPRTKEEWRAYLNDIPPARPDMPTFAAYQRLSRKEKILLNKARDDYHSALIIVRTPTMDKIHHQVRRRMRVNARQAAGARRGIVLDGPATIGKSTLVKMLAYDYEHELREAYPERFSEQYIVEDHIVDYTPVVYLSIGSQATPKDLSTALADYLALPYRSGATKSAITRIVLEQMRLCGVELVIIDDAHFMDLSLHEGKVVNDHLKYIANHTAATFVYTGVDLKRSGLFLEGTGSTRANQTAGRNTLIRMTNYTIKTREQRAEWLTVLLSLDEHLALYHHKPHTLPRLYKYLYDRTEGSICALSDLIREAAIEAVMTGEEAITKDVLDRIDISELAQARYEKFKTSQRKKGQLRGSLAGAEVN